jgi:hypothetical protein
MIGVPQLDAPSSRESPSNTILALRCKDCAHCLELLPFASQVIQVSRRAGLLSGIGMLSLGKLLYSPFLF